MIDALARCFKMYSDMYTAVMIVIQILRALIRTHFTDFKIKYKSGIR